MRYLWEKGKPRRVLHIQKFNNIGRGSMQTLCKIKLSFNASINAPFTLGRKVCKNCLRQLP